MKITINAPDFKNAHRAVSCVAQCVENDWTKASGAFSDGAFFSAHKTRAGNWSVKYQDRRDD